MKSPGRTSFKVRPGRRSDGVASSHQVGLLLTALFAAQAQVLLDGPCICTLPVLQCAQPQLLPIIKSSDFHYSNGLGGKQVSA
jgi:hypothetical protein